MSLAGVLGHDDWNVSKGSLKRKRRGLSRSASIWGINAHQRPGLQLSKSFNDLTAASTGPRSFPNSGSYKSFFPSSPTASAAPYVPFPPRSPIAERAGVKPPAPGPGSVNRLPPAPAATLKQAVGFTVDGDLLRPGDATEDETASLMIVSPSVDSLALEPKSLTFGSLVFLAYFCVCGGPYGLEVAVASGYPLYTMIALIIVPWLWSLPLALMCAELSTALPDNDGYILWVKTAFGPYAGYLVGFIGWANGVVDNALYPVLFMAYLQQLLAGYAWISDPWCYYGLQTGAIALVMLLNLVGVDVVGKLSALFAVVVLAPFAVLLVWAIVAGDFKPAGWIAAPPNLDGLTTMLNVIIWASSGYDSLSNVASELKNPKKTFPRAMACVILLTTGSYFLAFAASVTVNTNYADWQEGYFAVVAGQLGGQWFQTAVIVAAMVSSLGIFNALMCTSSQELRGLGKRDLLGIRALVWKHPRFRTPWLAIVFNSVVIFGFGFLNFSAILQLNNIFYSMLLLMQYSSLVRLRFTHKEIVRPYRISKSFPKTLVFITPPILICLFIIGSATYYNWFQGAIAVGFVVAVSISYFVVVRCRARGSYEKVLYPGVDSSSSSSSDESEA